MLRIGDIILKTATKIECIIYTYKAYTYLFTI